MAETRSRSNRHAGLEAGGILDRAIALARDEGADALTMRRLAAELGVATTSIYWHVGNREQLLTAMVQRHGERLAETPITGDTARERVLAVARLIWEGALADREITRLASSHGLSSLHAQHLELAMARELQEAGVVGESARDALRAITACVGGFIVAALLDDALPTDHRRTSVLAHLEDPGLDPTTRSALATSSHLPSLFDTTLQAVVDSLVPADLSANAYL
ncbi:MAG: helix-turn-helix domain-containing protein [Acidimicrobiales bacterium]|jgi:AcrR family transcriptional regulator|nr:TetR/AcrR family transcriptional regulator [Acidimicrobiia bacterium]HIL48929.1 TetR/AcrR family transcriptional regulator [Acidimicrobiia bacterium]